MFIANIIKGYISHRWINQLEVLNKVQARKKLLSGASLYFYEKYTTTPKDVFIDEKRNWYHTNPIVADDNGEFPEIFLAEDQYMVVLKDKNGADIARVETDKDFEL